MSIERDITAKPPTTCRKCGACCIRGIAGAVPFSDGERVPEWYVREHAKSLENRRQTAPCPWWVPDTSSGDERVGECLHYDDRPRECRSQEWGRGELLCLEMRQTFIELGMDRSILDPRLP